MQPSARQGRRSHSHKRAKRGNRNAPYPTTLPPCGGPDRRRRGGGAARQRGQGAHRERHRCRGRRRDGGDPLRRHGPDPGHRRRLRHRPPGAAHRLSPPRNQQAPHRPGPGRHRHPWLSGRGSGGHRRRQPPGRGLPAAGGRGRGQPPPGGGRPRGGGGRRVPGGHHHRRPGALFQHPRPAEVHEVRRRRGRRRGDPGGADRPQPPGALPAVHPGREGGAPHPRGREAPLRHLRRPGPGLRHVPGAGGGGRGERLRPGLCHHAPGLPGLPGHGDLLLLRPDDPLAPPHRRPGGGLRQPPAQGQVPRLRPPHRPAPPHGGRERPPRQDGGEVRPRAGGVLRRPPRGEGRPGRRRLPGPPGQASLSRGQSPGGLLPDHGRQDLPGAGGRSGQARRPGGPRPALPPPVLRQRAGGPGGAPGQRPAHLAGGAGPSASAA